jgi:hypothetical protein
MNHSWLRRTAVPALFCLACTVSGHTQQGRRGADSTAPTAGPVQTVDQRTASLKKMDGFVPVYLDSKADRLYLEITKFDTQFLYVRHIADGAGTNGLNRGAVSEPFVVHFSRVGPKVLLTAENTGWRAGVNEPAQQAAVKQAFPTSVLASFPVIAEDGDSHVLIDATDFLVRDAQGFAGRLGAGYRQDPARSMIMPENTKNFPLNTEIETLLTFTDEGSPAARAANPFGGRESGGLSAVSPDEHNITLRERQSFVQLPDAGYTPRVFDPRAGALVNTSFNDWSLPIGEPRLTRYLTRFRLIKKDPTKAVSDPVKPIIYYVDRGAPEPIRTALLEGLSWWNQAFLAAGFSNAFKAELLPEGADPFDIRYNVIMWVEGENRAFSNGLSVIDPRTGEILKGEVTLTAGRERQDFLITDSLLSPYKTSGKPDPQQLELVLQRIRQLAAHESGHTIGQSHNHAASSFGHSESVEDYPFPKIRITADGKLDLSHAYEPGLGEWDKISITYAYKQFPPNTTPAQEKAGLDKVLVDASKQGMYWLTDNGIGTVHPHSSQWDTGANSAAELDRLMKVRAIAMKNFSEAAIRPGVPMAELEDVLVPVYLLHRYQTEAVSQTIGGQDYRYAVRGDGQMVTKMIPGDEQRTALASLLKTLDPQMLTLPASILDLLPPRPPSMPRTQESFQGYAGPVFDPMAPVLAAADTTLDALLEPTRATRLMEFHARDASLPSLSEVLEATLKATWYAPALTGLEGQTQMTVNQATLEHLVALAASPAASPLAKAVVRSELAKLRAFATEHAKDSAATPETQAFYAAALEQMAGGRGGAAGATATAGAGGFGARRALTPTSIPSGAPIEPELTFMPN